MSVPGGSYAYEALTFGGHLIRTQYANASAAIIFTEVDYTKYKMYMFDLVGIVPSVSGANLVVEGGPDGVSWPTPYWEALNQAFSHVVNEFVQSMSATNLMVVSSQVSPQVLSGRILANPDNAHANVKQVLWHTNGSHSAKGQSFSWGGGFSVATGSINAFRFMFDTGNISSGAIRMYGMTK